MGQSTSPDTFDYNTLWGSQWDDMVKYGPTQRHIRRCIKDLLRPLTFDSVLDVGCGQATLLSELLIERPTLQVAGTDISTAGIELARRNVPQGHFEVLDITERHLDQSYDVVIASEVLEHITEDRTALRNLRAMTRKYLVISTPQGRMRRFEPEVVGHVRNYTRAEMEQKMAETGFRVLKVTEWGFPFYSPIYRNVLELTGSKGTLGKFGLRRKLLAKAMYGLFALNSERRGDCLVVLAEPTSRS